jgi:Family of unknown function (DUF6119)
MAREAEAGGEVLLVPDHDVDVPGQPPVDLLGAGLAADRAPQARPVVQVVRDHRPVPPGRCHRRLDDVRRGGRQRRVDAAGVQPAHAERAEQVLPVHVGRTELAGGGVAAVRDPDRPAYAEAALGEVESIADGAANAVVGHPPDERGVNAAGENQVLEQPPHLVVGERGDHRRAQAEAASQTDELSLDPWKRGIHPAEGDYNALLADHRNWRLLDKQNFHLPASYEKIEICDLLTERKQLLCVKRMTRSSTLSHLFMQGQVSAQLLTANLEGYRDRIMQDLKQLDSRTTFGTNSDWTVVYAIATPTPGTLASSLYFFSKVALHHAAQQLRSLGVRVAIARIPME